MARVLVTPQRLPNPALVGKTGHVHRGTSAASRCRRTRACSSRRSQGVGRDYPLSIEKLCPVLSFYVVSDWREGCERCKQILRYGGMGHTMSIHSQNDQVILEFGLKKPAFRIVRQHADDARIDRADDRTRSGDDARLRRLRRQHHVRQHLAAAPAEHQAAGVRDRASDQPFGAGGVGGSAIGSGPRAVAAGINARVLSQRIDQFLGSRGYRGEAGAAPQPALLAEPALPAPEPVVDAPILRHRPHSSSSVKKTCGWPFRRAENC